MRPESSEKDVGITHGRALGSVRLSRRGLFGAATGIAGFAGIVGSEETTMAPAAAASPRERSARGAGGGSTSLRRAGSRPNPNAPEGTDLVPEIENIVIVMQENHSFDNLLGTIGRGDGFRLGPNGKPTAAVPNGHGDLVHAYPMPNACQTGGVSNAWDVGHNSYADGANSGFVTASSAESMGYFTDKQLPFTRSLARTFPIADRWFCSVLAQTYPNRRFLISGTSLGLTNDTFPKTLPPNGTIFDSLNRHHITWKDYYSDLPSAAVYIPIASRPTIKSNLVRIEQFYKDAAAGTLPSVSLLEPNFSIQSEENPQDVQFGDQFLGAVVNAVMSSPQWKKTLMIWTYDEWGGWYDHVPPPHAVPPDNILPILPPGSAPGAFDRYGFRVPAGVISPLAKKNFVSHTVFDHTSILKTIEKKWNLPALTMRDANASDVFSMLDLRGKPAFLSPPTLADPANPTSTYRCLKTGPGTVPPPSAVRKA